MRVFNQERFISKYITKRDTSLFQADIDKNKTKLEKLINGKSVLVIGGAGTIGSSYIKSVLNFRPSRLYVVDINENGLTELTRDLRSKKDQYVPEDYKPYPINFKDAVFRKIFLEEGPFEIVANFAAHKHVRSEKDHYSIEAMIRNNVLDAANLLELMLQQPPEHFFCVSTDKATNPVNVMGASKKLMEDLILSYSDKLKITTARFANVAFSNGSLLFGFLERMMKGQPLSAPKSIKRYFVSPEESGQICMLACMLGESSDIFFPNLPQDSMETFSAIAVAFLKEYGFTPEYCHSEDEAKSKAKMRKEGDLRWPVCFFDTDTSGEKSFEEFYAGDEDLDRNTFNELGIIKNTPIKDIKEIRSGLQRLEELLSKKHIIKKEIVEVIHELIPNFQHIETGKSLDSKM